MDSKGFVEKLPKSFKHHHKIDFLSKHLKSEEISFKRKAVKEKRCKWFASLSYL